MKSAPAQQTFRDRVLVSLPQVEINCLEPHLYPVIFEPNRTLHDVGALTECELARK